MNKNAIKKFAIEARKKLIASVSDKAGMLGITPEGCSEPVSKGADFEIYKTIAGTEITLSKSQCEQRRKLKEQVETRGFEAVVEEVAYTWFNRICAIRFMEVNDYLPARVRVLSSEKEGKNEPDIVTQAPNVDLDFTDKEREYILDCKMNNKLDDLFKMLFIRQCNKLSEILPELFEATEDYTEMLLNISYTNKDDIIYMLVNQETGIPEADFNVSTIGEDGQPTGQVEIIGWLYQYYNTELKDDTFAQLKKNIKISKERIPAATQLFTPDWIVRYMVENSVGRLWIEHLRAVDPMVNEKEVAEKFGWKYYLPETEQAADVNAKLAEIRTSYKDLKPEDITCIDPCMGSGHILVAMFDVLMDIYKSAGYSERDAVFKIVEHNIHGLDIDKRAYQLAYFAVMMKGRAYNRRFFVGEQNEKGERVAIQPNVCKIEESNGVNRAHLKYFGAGLSQNEKSDAENQIEGLFDELRDATEYGSILNIKNYNWNLLERFVGKESSEEQLSFETLGINNTQFIIKKLIKVGQLLSNSYDVVVTNPPYMGCRNMNSKMVNYIESYYPNSKTDIFSCFLERGFSFAKKNRFNCMVTMQSWMFLTGFDKFRKETFSRATIETLLHMDNMVMGIAFGTSATVFRNTYMPDYLGNYTSVKYVDLNDDGMPDEFPVMKNRSSTASINQFNCIEGTPVAYWLSDTAISAFDNKTLGEYAKPRQGMATSDNNRFLRYWFEVETQKICYDAMDEETAERSKCKWFPYNKGGSYRKWYGNNEYLINWENNGYEVKELATKLYKCVTRTIKNIQFYFKKGITWSTLSSGNFSARYCGAGFLFDTKGSTCFFDDEDKIQYCIAFLNGKVAKELLKVLAPTMDFNAGAIARLPVKYDINRKPRIDELVQSCIDISKEDWDSYETSWDFKIHPLVKISLSSIMDEETSSVKLSEVYKTWETLCDGRYNKIKENEEELNSIFIEIYGLQDELTPFVEEKDITVRKADLQRDIKSLISYSVGCMFGRYTLDAEGIAYAGGGWNRAYYLKFIPDGDNCIPVMDEEYFEGDVLGRFTEFVKVVYGEEYLEENLDFIANALAGKGKISREIIRNYFLNDFMDNHLKVFQKRPIYWMFDSGKANGFKALVYLHRYNADMVGTVRTEYLHKVQQSIENALKSAEYISENAVNGSEKSKATKLITKYAMQLAEIKQYDEAMAHIANQRIDIDLDDGVKVNYEKFQGVEVAQEGKKALKIDLLAKIK